MREAARSADRAWWPAAPATARRASEKTPYPFPPVCGHLRPYHLADFVSAGGTETACGGDIHAMGQAVEESGGPQVACTGRVDGLTVAYDSDPFADIV